MLFELRGPADRALGDAAIDALQCCSLDDVPRDVEDNKIVAQLIHIVRSTRDIKLYRSGGKTARKPQSSYDRLLFFRDVLTSKVFAVFTENDRMSHRLMTTDIRIGMLIDQPGPGDHISCHYFHAWSPSVCPSACPPWKQKLMTTPHGVCLVTKFDRLVLFHTIYLPEYILILSIGMYVTLCQPGMPMDSKLRDILILTYDDFLWKVPRPADMKMIGEISPDLSMSSFVVKVSQADFQFSKLRFLEKHCNGYNCDCLLKRCSCVGSQTSSRYVLSFRLDLKIPGAAEEKVEEFTSDSFTSYFVDSAIQVRNIVLSTFQ